MLSSYKIFLSTQCSNNVIINASIISITIGLVFVIFKHNVATCTMLLHFWASELECNQAHKHLLIGLEFFFLQFEYWRKSCWSRQSTQEEGCATAGAAPPSAQPPLLYERGLHPTQPKNRSASWSLQESVAKSPPRLRHVSRA